MTNSKERHAAKTEGEYSDYQKEIEATDNVILCVAKAEKMIRSIGASLCAENNASCAKYVEPDTAFEEYD